MPIACAKRLDPAPRSGSRSATLGRLPPRTDRRIPQHRGAAARVGRNALLAGVEFGDIAEDFDEGGSAVTVVIVIGAVKRCAPAKTSIPSGDGGQGDVPSWRAPVRLSRRSASLRRVQQLHLAPTIDRANAFDALNHLVGVPAVHFDMHRQGTVTGHDHGAGDILDQRLDVDRCGAARRLVHLFFSDRQQEDGFGSCASDRPYQSIP